ncbi:MAG: hypothetical protein K5640_07080 [Treponema sp.]|nr:hypothetical protein [Treponema sp.]
MATGQIINAQLEIEEVQQALSGTSKSLKSIQKSVLRVAAKSTANRVKAAIISSDLHKRTGELQKAYVYKVKKDGNEANVFPKALTGTDRTIFPKAMTLSYGHDGPTKRAKNWRIAPRGFVQAGEQFAEAGGYMNDVQKLIDKELQKYWG